MPAGMIPVGTAADYASDGLHKVPNTSILIGRDAGGLYALTAICTHQGCNMNKYGTVLSTGIRCTCHGSRFSTDGDVMLGPALKPLRAYSLVPGCDGQLYVDTSIVVPNTHRMNP